MKGLLKWLGVAKVTKMVGIIAEKTRIKFQNNHERNRGTEWNIIEKVQNYYLGTKNQMSRYIGWRMLGLVTIVAKKQKTPKQQNMRDQCGMTE